MKQLKLEVGKTYRNRNGEEVRIVGNNSVGMGLYRGNNSKWYTESGGWDVYGAEHPEDLIEEVPETLTATRHTFAIPNGMKEVTIEQVSNRIVVEMVPGKVEPKPGDVMVNDRGSVYIFKDVYGSYHKDYAWLGDDGRLVIGGHCFSGRPATPEEAQPLWDALKKAGKKWNPETMEVEEVPERERILEWSEHHLSYGHHTKESLAEVIEAYLKYREIAKKYV